MQANGEEFPVKLPGLVNVFLAHHDLSVAQIADMFFSGYRLSVCNEFKHGHLPPAAQAAASNG
jgi:hypothetical protein